jgi:hypothetical protein
MGWRLPWDFALDRVNNRSRLLSETGLYSVGELSKPIVHLFR